MQPISTTSLRRELSRILDRVAAGEEIVITRNGAAIARLVPERPETALRRRELALAESDALRLQLIASGKALTIEEIIRFKNGGHSPVS